MSTWLTWILTRSKGANWKHSSKTYACQFFFDISSWLSISVIKIALTFLWNKSARLYSCIITHFYWTASCKSLMHLSFTNLHNIGLHIKYIKFTKVVINNLKVFFMKKYKLKIWKKWSSQKHSFLCLHKSVDASVISICLHENVPRGILSVPL